MTERRCPASDIVVVANRLPVQREDGRWVPSPGGLVRALDPILRDRCAGWVGWPASSEITEPWHHGDVLLHPVVLNQQERERYYEGFSNDTLWPLFHDAIRPSTFDPDWFECYRTVNERFADAVASVVAPGGTAWVHDYHLLLVPGLLRERRPDVRIGFFLHIPFPPAELFGRLPWREELAAGMLGADVIGFQRESGVRNFAGVAARFGGAEGEPPRLHVGERTVRVRAHPISIDVDEISAIARRLTAEARAVRDRLGNPRHVLLGVDRLDYTKGIGHRLEAFEAALDTGLLDPDHSTLVQIAVPTRSSVPQYAEERAQVEMVVGRINGRYGRVGRPVVHYLHQNLSLEELVALYRAADVLLVTPLGDGMNLVAKEFVASRVDGRGVLVLSEFAGAADDLREAVLVNPFDQTAVRDAIGSSVRLSDWEARTRMMAMQARLAVNDVHMWAQRFLDELTGARAAWRAA